MELRATGLAYTRDASSRIRAPEPKVMPLTMWRSCVDCPYRPICKSLVQAGLPVLCERLEEPEAKVLKEVFAWE